MALTICCQSEHRIKRPASLTNAGGADGACRIKLPVFVGLVHSPGTLRRLWSSQIMTGIVCSRSFGRLAGADSNIRSSNPHG